MRKVCILLFASLALCATCLGQSAPTNQPGSQRIKPPTATSGGASTSSQSRLTESLIAREKEVWELIKKKDIQGFSGYLAEDQLYVTGNGVHTKAETGKGIAESGPSELSLDEWKVMMINKETALVTYRVTAKGTVNGQAMTRVTRESTVWAKRGGKWLAVFHQDTQVESGM
ncbi:MAG TPA: nuclear transport factor 2 family protein [Pyrinomonadaceae bacterium]